jgi:hypothetical protein
LEPELSKFPSKDYSFVDQKMLRHLSSYVVSPNGVPIDEIQGELTKDIMSKILTPKIIIYSVLLREY